MLSAYPFQSTEGLTLQIGIRHKRVLLKERVNSLQYAVGRLSKPNAFLHYSTNLHLFWQPAGLRQLPPANCLLPTDFWRPYRRGPTRSHSEHGR